MSASIVDMQEAPRVLSADSPIAEALFCSCGASLFEAAPDCPFEISPEALSPVAVPAGLTLVPGGGGSPHRPLALIEPPRIALAATEPTDLLALLRYAGLTYAGPDSPAAQAALQVFSTGRAVALDGPYDAVTFDWDQTLGNGQICVGVGGVMKARRRKSPPPAVMAAAAVLSIETPRPFVMELALGMMAGFALRQGLACFSEWRRYRPQVGVATHTWPDRLALTAHYCPLLPLMEGRLPGAPGTYRHFMSGDLRAIVHLHDFLDYAAGLVRRFDQDGFAALAPDEADELMRCLEDGGAHHRKPLGAWRARGWDPARLLHIDDAPKLIADLTRQAVLAGCDGARFLHVPQPHSRLFTGVKSWHMLALPALWRSRPRAIRGVVANLARMEWARSSIPDLLRHLGHPVESWPRAALPAGTLMPIYPATTTVGAFWEHYVAPVTGAKALIRDVRRRHGGLRAIRRARLRTF